MLLGIGSLLIFIADALGIERVVPGFALMETLKEAKSSDGVSADKDAGERVSLGFSHDGLLVW